MTMNKPSYIGCSEECRYWSVKKCWKENHIPFAGYLAGKYRNGISVAYQEIFNRWLRRKKIAWPDEVKQFNALYEYKHPELIRGPKVTGMMSLYNYLGAVFDTSI